MFSVTGRRARGAIVGAIGVGILLLAGCGGSSGGGGPKAEPAPPAADFPAPKGQPLLGFLKQNATEANLIVSPSQKVLRVGPNRYAFGIFNVDRSQVTDAKVALYASQGNRGQGPTIGPFPARIDTLATEPAFHSKTTADDPGAALAVYVTDVPFDKPGIWTVAAMIKKGSSSQAVLLPTVSKVGQFPQVPVVGAKAPLTHTDTAASVGNPSLLDTRVPPDTMHGDDFADVLGEKPVVLLFASPALCISRTCGPVADVTEQVKQSFGDRVAFIHQEPYVNNQIKEGFRPPLLAFGLSSEPWVFVIDRNGIIRSEIEGPFGVDELTKDVEQVAGPAK
jgi:hypothetical protein